MGLYRFYIRNGVKWKKMTKQLHAESLEPNKKYIERMVFAFKLNKIISQNKPLIYMDETTFNLFMKQSKGWYYKEDEFEVPLPKKREEGFTLMGALGNCMHKPFFG